jgi:hypothetical protein
MQERQWQTTLAAHSSKYTACACIAAGSKATLRPVRLQGCLLSSVSHMTWHLLLIPASTQLCKRKSWC